MTIYNYRTDTWDKIGSMNFSPPTKDDVDIILKKETIGPEITFTAKFEKDPQCDSILKDCLISAIYKFDHQYNMEQMATIGRGRIF